MGLLRKSRLGSSSGEETENLSGLLEEEESVLLRRDRWLGEKKQVRKFEGIDASRK